MKKIFIYLSFIITFASFAQPYQILPLQDSELCPNQEYTFTISGFQTQFSGSVYGENGAIVTQPLMPSTNGSAYNMTFKGRFSDLSGEQIFRLSGPNGEAFRYRGIKTLWGSYKQNNYDLSMTARICDATPIVINLSGQYELPLSSPISYFGSINRYMYTIPAG